MISAELYVFGTLVYLILASGKEQWWANGVGSKVNDKQQIQPTNEICSNGSLEDSGTLNKGQKSCKECQGSLIDEKLDLPKNTLSEERLVNYGSVQVNSESTIKE